MLKDTSWDRALEVSADGHGLVGHAGAVLLRKLADQCGLTAALDAALARAGAFPQLSRGVVLVSPTCSPATPATPTPVFSSTPADRWSAPQAAPTSSPST